MSTRRGFLRSVLGLGAAAVAVPIVAKAMAREPFVGVTEPYWTEIEIDQSIRAGRMIGKSSVAQAHFWQLEAQAYERAVEAHRKLCEWYGRKAMEYRDRVESLQLG